MFSAPAVSLCRAAGTCTLPTLNLRRLLAAIHVHGVPRILTLNPDDFARYPHVVAVRPASL
jgi:hypothetical protein